MTDQVPPDSAMAAGSDWSWETYPEYLDFVERTPKGINYAGYVGHSALRTWAMASGLISGVFSRGGGASPSAQSWPSTLGAYEARTLRMRAARRCAGCGW